MKTKINILRTTILILLPFLYAQSLIAQSNKCAYPIPFCSSFGGATVVFANMHDGSDVTNTANYGCLGAGVKPNPTWFSIQSTSAGVMTFSVSQTVNANGTGTSLNVNYVVWGPFSSPQNKCTSLGNPLSCSASASLTETISINSTAVGQYFIILMTNPSSTPGYIRITQTSGAPTDCADACPLDNFTLIGTVNGTTVNVPSGSVVNCTDIIMFNPPNLPFNNDPFHTILTPCQMIAHEPFRSNLASNGTMISREIGGPLATTTVCPTCPRQIGQGIGVPGDNLYGYYGYKFPGAQHDYAFCKGAGAIGTTTVTLNNCWDNIVFDGPVIWNNSSPSCFTLTAPANTSVGTASYAISPASGAGAGTDFRDGFAFVNPALLQTGTTYTLTYTFNGPSNCAPVHGYFILSTASVPTISAIPSQTFCSGNTTNAINFVSSPPGVAYSWTNNNTNIGIAATGSTNIGAYTAPNVFGSATGQFIVTPKQAGCSGSPTVFNITVNSKPGADAIPASGTILDCSTSSVSLIGSGGGNYQWTGPGIVSGAASATVIVNQVGTYSLQTSLAGCTSNYTTIVVTQDITTPTLSAIPMGTLSCSSPTTVINVTSSGSSIVWTGATTGSVTSNNTSIPVTANGNYTVVAIGNNGCNTNTIITIQQDSSIPTLSLSTAPVFSIACSSSSGTLFAVSNASNNATYTWITPTGSTVIGNTLTVSGTGVYTVSVTDNTNGCLTTTQFTVESIDVPPNLSTNNNVLFPCVAASTVLTASSTETNVAYSWQGPMILSSLTNDTITIGSVGVYTVTLTNLTTNCTNTQTISVVLAGINALFTANPNTGVEPLVVNFTNLTSPVATGYNWVFGDGNTSTLTNPNNTFTVNGTYAVMLTATLGICLDTAYATIIVDEDLMLFIPEIFTPNADGKNDLFAITNIDKYPNNTLQIYNRWGSLVYLKKGYNNEWNGKTNQSSAGKGILPASAYYFILELGDGKTKPITGYVELRY